MKGHRKGKNTAGKTPPPPPPRLRKDRSKNEDGLAKEMKNNWLDKILKEYRNYPRGL
jgi:hypothetical protein